MANNEHPFRSIKSTAIPPKLGEEPEERLSSSPAKTFAGKDYLELIPEEDSTEERKNEPIPPAQAVVEEQTKLLEHKQPVTVPQDIGELLTKKPYENAFDKADSEELEEYRPILHLSKKVEVDRGSDDKASERRNLIQQRLQKIDEVQNEAEQVQLDKYSEKFNANAEKDMILLAEIELEQLNDENKKIEELQEAREREERTQYEKHCNELRRLEEESKDELVHRGELLRKQLYRNEQESIERTREKNQQIKHAFGRVSDTLKGYLKETKQEVEIKYRDLSISHKEDRHNLARSSATKSEVTSWKKQHQVVEVRIELTRCVKDKLPKGRYAILCSILDRIGGNPLEYGNAKSKKWRRITAPKIHSGEYYLSNLRFEKSLLMVAPPRAEVRPSMVYLFELFLLKSKEYTNDQVLGWGVFPLINADFELNKGKHKIPLLFGPVDHTIDKYGDIEKSYKKNIDNWLCNLYFSIKQKDTLANPYSVQLVLDEDTQSRYNKYLSGEAEKNESEQKRKLNNVALPENDEELTTAHEANLQQAQEQKFSDRIPGAEEGEYSDGLRRGQGQAEEKEKRRNKRLTRPRHFDEYTFHIPHVDLKSNVVVSRKVRYIMDEALSDLGFRNIMSIDFWISLMVLLLVLWIRAYMHTFGSWLLLKIASIPVTAFDPMIYGFKLGYATRNVGVMVGVILFGNLFNTLLFGTLIFLAWGLQKCLRKAPRLVYKFVASYGIALIFDFLLIALVDISRLNWEGEMFILYSYYKRADNNGTIGGIIIALIYGGLLVLNTFIFYNYLVFLHMEGRIIDIYARVTADSTYFFIPLDNEVSARYLRWVVTKVRLENNMGSAEGMIGSKHFAITYHTVTDPAGNYKKDLTHVSIYRRRDDGKLVLYRHFVKAGDGAICELEEGVPFTVDEHPFLETWPEHTRKFLGSETQSLAPEELKLPVAQGQPTKRESQEDIPGTYRLIMGGDSPTGKKEDISGLEPQVLLIKNE